jgi:hypothetical protein
VAELGAPVALTGLMVVESSLPATALLATEDLLWLIARGITIAGTKKIVAATNAMVPLL